MIQPWILIFWDATGRHLNSNSKPEIEYDTCINSSSQVKIFYSGKYTIISYNIGKTETHLGLFVPLWDEFTVDMW